MRQACRRGALPHAREHYSPTLPAELRGGLCYLQGAKVDILFVFWSRIVDIVVRAEDLPFLLVEAIAERQLKAGFWLYPAVTVTLIVVEIDGDRSLKLHYVWGHIDPSPKPGFKIITYSGPSDCPGIVRDSIEASVRAGKSAARREE